MPRQRAYAEGGVAVVEQGARDAAALCAGRADDRDGSSDRHDNV
jgi:hypothetical protein